MIIHKEIPLYLFKERKDIGGLIFDNTYSYLRISTICVGA